MFLVGDAAHRVTPRGGTGMNTAIADGYDLGWLPAGHEVQTLRAAVSRHTRPHAILGVA